MMIVFVSQCEKKALKRTRRVLDAFADRIGDNTWQTVITDEGLQAVKKLLRKTASKNTAVSCHWLRSRSRSDFLWVVGNKRQFNHRGVVAVNRTKKKLLFDASENHWQYASSIQIVATIAALLHDIGKSTIGFQNKLMDKNKSRCSDPYRHEWISLKLFEAMVWGCQTDEAWLSRLSNIDLWLSENTLKNTLKQCEKEKTTIAKMPPLAQWVAWLIISHHRLPPFSDEFLNNLQTRREQRGKVHLKTTLNRYYEKYLSAFEYWVKLPKNKLSDIPEGTKNNFWQIKDLVVDSPNWQRELKRWVNKALNDTMLKQISQQAVENQQAISDTFLLYLSRLCLMVGDHNYSSLKSADKRRLKGASYFQQLAANTERETKEIKQSLDEHLLGVACFTKSFAWRLPAISHQLPRLKNHQALSQMTTNPRFQWQNRAYQLAQKLQKDSQENGFFGINMASTGCGKTIANARIMYGLADPEKGARFTIALGLRVLTLQTGQSFRKDLKLNAEQLAILVGGQANKKLFELNNDADSASRHQNFLGESDEEIIGEFGSESDEEIVDEWVDSGIDYRDEDVFHLGTVIENDKARDLLFSPVVVCTVDHIIQASECRRGGRYIAPMLRLLSSDLILDEPDDFDQSDLPALARLVHLAGVLGSRVLLSSATLTPDLLAGLFSAYREGRRLFNKSQNKPAPNVVCAWFDEQEKACVSSCCADTEVFKNAHGRFISRRESFLSQQAIRRKADILALDLAYQRGKEAIFYAELGQQIIDGAWKLHQDHQRTIPSEDKVISIGLVRIANIKHITQIVMQLFAKANVPDDVHIHLSCYHSRQLLVLRNSLEKKLDRILDQRDGKASTLFAHPEIKEALQKNKAKHHIFIVLATPVAEVGRDHDYDWAIVEPSSMRSIIQLAGRVWRHRPDKVAKKSNILIFQYNLRWFTRRDKETSVFTRPGFENEVLKPETYDLNALITTEQLSQIDAIPRIVSPQHDKIQTLSDLEHHVMQALLNSPTLNYVNAYWHKEATANRVHTHLQQVSPFRASAPQEAFLFIPSDGNDDKYDVYYAQTVYDRGLKGATPQNKMIQPLNCAFSHPQMSPWLVTGLRTALAEIQEKQPDKSLHALAIRFSIVSLEEKYVWQFNPYLGFVNK